jgi:hypothetical protein
MKNTAKNAVKKLLAMPLRLFLRSAARSGFFRQIVRDQPWLVEERNAELQDCEKRLRQALESRVHGEKEQLQRCFQEEKERLRAWHFDERCAELGRLRKEGKLTGMTPAVTVICLVYQSTAYAKCFYESLHRHTPELQSGEARLLFVANDATEEVLTFLRENDYPFVENNNPKQTLADLKQRGYAWPDYIARVYRGYNFGIQHAETPEIVLMNSDNFVSRGWLHNLRKRLDNNRVVSPVLVQPHAVFPNPINGTHSRVMDFGRRLDDFEKMEPHFVAWAETIKQDSVGIGNPFMPLLLYKWQAEVAGGYPCGNIADDAGNIKLTGDTYFFKKLAALGIEHINANDSIVYHLQEGEKYEK